MARTPRTGARAATGELARRPLTELDGIGPSRAEKLARLGLVTLRDALLCVPRALDEWPAPVAIARAKELAGASETVARIAGEIVRWSFSRFGRRSLVRVRVRDASGELDVLFFNQPWLRERFVKGARIEVLGRVVEAQGAALAATKLASEAMPLPSAGSLSARYPSADGVGAEFVARLCAQVAAGHAADLGELLTPSELEHARVPELAAAVRELHAPTSRERFDASARRVALERMLELQARVVARRREREAGSAVRVERAEELSRGLARKLPFELTAGQRDVLATLARELERPVPMRRLLQGDVGSGKTVVGVLACALAAASGAQAAFLAPTELLAEQHFASQRELLARMGARAALLTGSMPSRERAAVRKGLENSSFQAVFGTHALLSDDVRFARLALAVIDEQQRFGVAQRARLFDKGRDVHGLLMTATPIPRSLALTIYGDLDVALLREKPPGRGAVTTRWLREGGKRAAVAELAHALARGEQAYWVVPRIEGADDDGAPSAIERHAELSRGALAAHGVELAHGRMPSDERAARLERFRSGAARVLVATTVIEVGVDVPRATAIVIEGAERFGLAQLHQLRGRVGRSELASTCLLLGRDVARERFEALERTHDGFAIAEADLAARGMGDLLGLRQAGANNEGLDGPLDVGLLLLARDLLSGRAELARDYSENSRGTSTSGARSSV